MWWKVALGAVIGLIIGTYVEPGYALWVALGAIAGYFTHMWVSRPNQEKGG